ncbi:WASH complex subunit 4 [Ooceraea biroi]|uniref:WASH complex subunit n=1 Tax=Ooceraea biroi TaxID=2015173 RepID=A0A026WA52_OOCBI|nr:WASH complex subunit 4 [Ooceraea biroi]XP_011340679.1 WASH complex subunit 4 [Ooceraea biroi]XP_026827992.1 WASH complex subunit 4 [Ooceraea biroi]EZA52972.1 WASH complex subunit [Ooceraea biroi]
MIEPPAWNFKKDESIYKAAGAMHLRKYGEFFENLVEKSWKRDSTLEYIMEGPLRLVYKATEDISILSLVEMENKVLSKLLAAVAGTCREIRLLKVEAASFYAKLFVHGERCVDDDLTSVPKLLSDLQDLSIFANRMSTVVHLATQQLASLSGAVHEIYLPALIEGFIDLFVILMTLDEIVDAQPTITEQWKKYRMHVRSMMHNPSQFGVAEAKLETFDHLLKDLQEKLLRRNMFLKAIEHIMDVNKGVVMSEQIVNYLKNTMTDVESKSNDHAALNKNWIRVNVGVAVMIKLFGACDKKLIKRVLETNKRFYAVTLVGNVMWVPSRFLSNVVPKETGNVVSPQVGEKILQARTQRLSVTVNSLIHRSMTWCVEMQSILTRTNLQVSDIGQKRTLLTDLVTLLAQMREIIAFVTNLHALLSKPMSRNLVQLICRLVELQKSLQTTFYALGPIVVQSQAQVLQYLAYYILAMLETARKGLVQKDKSYSRERLDALSLIGLSMRLMGGPASTDRRLIVRCALACASQLTDTFREEDVVKLRFLLDSYDTVAELYELVSELGDYSLLLHHQNMLPAYLSSVVDGNSNICHLAHLFVAFNSAVGEQESELKEKRIAELRESLVKSVLKPACHEIETSLRLHVHAHLKLDSTNPFNVGAKDGGKVVRVPPLPLAENMVCVKRFAEHYLDDMFYNLTTVALHDWRTYRTMHALASYKMDLDTVQDHLPTQTLEQGLDALEIMRNIHVFVSRYLYNLNTQTFVEHNSGNKHLNTIGIRHIANSIRTHGTGIMSTTVNFVYQFLRVKLHTFSQFLFDEHIKSRLMRDIRFVRAQREAGTTPYTYERAEKFQKGIRKLGMTADGLSYLDQFRQLITQIGNALGYVRLIRSGGLHASSNAVSFLPDIEKTVPFESLCRGLNYSVTTQAAARRLEDDIADLVRNFTEGIHYFKLLVDVFASAFRDAKSYHLQQFYAIVPPLTLSFVDNSVSNKEKMFKKNQTGAAFTDDGFAMGIAYINALLDQSVELDGLHWFKTVEQHIAQEKLAAESKDDHGDEKLQQTRALTLKRLAERNAEFQLLYYSLSGARVFFKQPDT